MSGAEATITMKRTGVLLAVLCASLSAGAAGTGQDADSSEQPPGEPDAAAASGSEEAGAPEPESDETVLDAIVVTATKREVSAREVPMSINAFAGEDLEARGLTQLEDYVRYTPGVYFQKGYGPAINEVQIRGITVGAAGGPTGLFLDDLPLTNPSIVGTRPDLDSFDMSRLEIIKGPVGTMFGGSALAGAVRYVPNRPDLAQSEGRILYGVATAAHSDQMPPSAGFMYNQPLGDTFAVRLAGVLRTTPGVYDDLTDTILEKDADKVTKTNARILATWQPIDRLTVDGMLYRWTVDNGRVGFADNEERFERSNTPGPQHSNNEEYYGQLKLGYDFESSSVTGALGYVDKVNDSIFGIDRAVSTDTEGGSDLVQGQDLAAKATTYELRWQSSVPSESRFFLLDEWDWMAGGFYFLSKQQAGIPLSPQAGPSDLFLGAAPSSDGTRQAGTYNFTRADAREIAVFGDVTRRFGASWELNLGLRFYRQQTDIASQEGPADAEVNYSEFQGKLEEAGFNPKVALKYTWNQSIKLYASASRGFRFGGVNANCEICDTATGPTDRATNSEVPKTFGSDHLWSYELGVRTDWFDRTVQADVAVFYIDWQNLQVAQQADFDTFVTNAGAAVSRGVEGGVRARLPAGLSFSMNGSYLDAELAEQFDRSAGNLLGTGVRTSSDPVLPGSPLPNAPTWSGSSSLGYAEIFGPWLLNGTLSLTYQGDRYTFLGDATAEDEFHAVDFSLGLRRPDWFMPSLDLAVTNLTNEQPILRHSRISLTDSNQQDVFFLTPRTIRLTTGWQF